MRIPTAEEELKRKEEKLKREEEQKKEDEQFTKQKVQHWIRSYGCAFSTHIHEQEMDKQAHIHNKKRRLLKMKQRKEEYEAKKRALTISHELEFNHQEEWKRLGTCH